MFMMMMMMHFLEHRNMRVKMRQKVSIDKFF